jgi:hypothetical protein
VLNRVQSAKNFKSPTKPELHYETLELDTGIEVKEEEEEVPMKRTNVFDAIDAFAQEKEEEEARIAAEEAGSEDVDDTLFFEALRESTAQHDQMKRALSRPMSRSVNSSHVSYPSVVKLDSTQYLREKAELRLLRYVRTSSIQDQNKEKVEKVKASKIQSKERILKWDQQRQVEIEQARQKKYETSKALFLKKEEEQQQQEKLRTKYVFCRF